MQEIKEILEHFVDVGSRKVGDYTDDELDTICTCLTRLLLLSEKALGFCHLEILRRKKQRKETQWPYKTHGRKPCRQW